jgi:hypothetical protein
MSKSPANHVIQKTQPVCFLCVIARVKTNLIPIPTVRAGVAIVVVDLVVRAVINIG